MTIRQLLRRCLQKDPRQRLRDIGDARLQLQEALSEPAGRPAEQTVPRSRVVWFGALAAVLAVVASTFAWLAFDRPRSAGPAQTVRFAIQPPQGLEFPVDFPNAVFSPDGSSLLFVLSRGQQRFLAIRSLGSAEPTKIAGTDDASRPFFSPDGRWVAFTQHRQLKRVPVEGGTPLVICDAEWGGGTWNVDDTIIFTLNYTSGLWRVPARRHPAEADGSGSRPRRTGALLAKVLPDGRHVIYTGFSTPVERSRISLYSLDTGQQRTLIEGGMHPFYTPTGHLLYAGRGSIVAVPFDLRQLSVTGTAVVVLDDVLSNPSNGLAQFGISTTGSIAYVRASSATRTREILWADRKGGLRPALPGVGIYAEPLLSPDGRRLMMTIEEPKRDVWTYDFDREVMSKVTAGAASDFGAVGAPDGQHIVFASERPAFHVYRKSINGTAEEPLVTGQYHTQPTSFSRDGRWVVDQQSDPKTQGDLWMVSFDGDRKTTLLATVADEGDGVVSPDGRWLAYTSDASGREEGVRQGFPEAGERWQVSSAGGHGPRWARDGRELFYLSDGRVMGAAVDVSARGFAVGKPAALLDGNYLFFDVAPDGQRFIVLRRDPAAQRVRVQVVLNWLDELRKRMASGPR